MAPLTGKRRWVLMGCIVVAAGGVGVALLRTAIAPMTVSRQDACAQVKQPASSGASANWIAVSDSSPQAVTQLVASLSVPYPDPTVSLTPDTPLLVHPIRMQPDSDLNACPHWLVAERNPSGHIAVIADYVYDYPHARVRFSNAGELSPSDPRYSAPFPYLSADDAAALVKSQRGVDIKADPAPELVFLPIDVGLPEQPGPAANWRGGGSWATDPIWLVAGADGRDYFVGTDRHVYTLGDLPLS